MEKKNTLAKNISWSFAEKLLSQGISMVISIMLARLLSPDDYGILAIVNVFIVLADVFVVNGMGVALIQDKDADNTTICTDFYLSIMVGIALYVVLFMSAPWIAGYYEMPELISVVRILGLKIPVASIYTILHAIIARKMQFQKLVLPTVFSTFSSGIMGILTALMGWGVWALVTQTLMYQILMMLSLVIATQWKPKLRFSMQQAKQHLSFSSKVVTASLVNTFVAQLQTMAIGKVYSSTDAAYYNNGVNYPQRIIGIVESSVNAVTFPAIANVKDNQKQVKEIMQNTIRHLSFLIVPMMIGLALCTEDVIRVLLTDKWLPSVPYMQIVCLTFVFMPINGVNYQAVKAVGKGDLFLNIQLIKTVINVAALFIALPHGMLAIAWSGFISGFGTVILNVYPAGKYYDYGLFQQLKDLLPACLYCLPMIVILSWMNRYLGYSNMMMLVSKIVVGVITYFAMAYIFKSSSLSFVILKVKEIIQRRPHNEEV